MDWETWNQPPGQGTSWSLVHGKEQLLFCLPQWGSLGEHEMGRLNAHFCSFFYPKEIDTWIGVGVGLHLPPCFTLGLHFRLPTEI